MSLFLLSYRAETAGPHAGRLKDHLTRYFEEAAVFFDRDSLNPGDRWRDVIGLNLERAVAVLAIIDRHWAASFGQKTDDVLLVELETAIRLEKIVPVLVGGASKPDVHDLPAVIQSIFEYQWFAIDETRYAASVAELIAMLERLEGLSASIESRVIDLLEARDYEAAERLVLRQPETARQGPSLSVYLALAQLGGRSFNALDPAERQTIEKLLRRARSRSDLALLLLAILEIDYYQLHGLVSDEPVPLKGTVPTDPRLRSLLADLSVSPRARRELQLDALSMEAAR